MALVRAGLCSGISMAILCQSSRASRSTVHSALHCTMFCVSDLLRLFVLLHACWGGCMPRLAWIRWPLFPVGCVVVCFLRRPHPRAAYGTLKSGIHRAILRIHHSCLVASCVTPGCPLSHPIDGNRPCPSSPGRSHSVPNRGSRWGCVSMEPGGRDRRRVGSREDTASKRGGTEGRCPLGESTYPVATTPNRMDMWEPYLGRRVEICRGFETHRGTVLYIGPVDGKKGTWAGVEWDQPNRGKHNGTYHGHTYFRCRKPGKFGSFLRPEALDFGVTLVQAIRNKYVEGETEKVREMYVHTASEQKVEVQLVGENQVHKIQSNTLELQRVYLNGRKVSSVDEGRVVADSVPNIRELDLSSNLINDWETVNKAGEELRHLTLLDLSDNMLPQNCACLAANNFQNLRVLVLNKCEMEWNTAYEAAHCMPYLEELHLCENELMDVECLPGIDNVFANLKRLNLDDNKIDDWGKVDWLKSLPKLEALQLNGNGLTQVCYTSGFLLLQTLLLANNNISHWSAIDQLNSFPQLTELRTSNNPISSEDNRFEMVSRISKLKLLNGSCITERERKDSEIKYLRKVLEECPSGSIDMLRNDHPRLEELKTQHNIEHHSSTTPALRNESLKHSLYQTTIYCECSRSVCDRVKKNLPGTTTVAKLKMMCERLFKVPLPEQQMHLKDSASPACYVVEEEKTLSMLTTDLVVEIFVSEVSRSSLSEERSASQRARELLESQQLQHVSEELAEAEKERTESHTLAIAGQLPSQRSS